MIILVDGSTWPLLPLDESDHLKDINNTLEFGNHQGAVQQKELLLTLVNDHVVRGFALPRPRRTPRSIEHPTPKDDQRTRKNHPKE